MQHQDPNGYDHAQGHILQVRSPDARQKKLGISAFDGRELNNGLFSGFLEWSRRFERQFLLKHSSGGLEWPQDVKVDLLVLFLSGIAYIYYNRQVAMWWSQLLTLQYVIEKMLQAFKTALRRTKK